MKKLAPKFCEAMDFDELDALEDQVTSLEDMNRRVFLLSRSWQRCSYGL